jgi:hypothetical protein
MDKAHILIRTDHRGIYLIEESQGADRITLATAKNHSEAFQIARNLSSWTIRDPDNVPFPIFDRSRTLT